MRYIDIARWIDDHAYDKDVDENLLFENLYHLAYMLAKKREFFVNYSWYDEFALYFAGEMFRRYRRNTKDEKIFAVLFYMRKTVALKKNTFLASKKELVSSDSREFPVAPFRLEQYANSYTYIGDQLDFAYSIAGVERTVYNYLRKIPRKKNSAEWDNIYISCLLTLLKSISPTITDSMTEHGIDVQFRKCRDVEPVLYHLDKKMSNYIKVLVTEIRHCMALEISYDTDGRITPNALTDAMSEDGGNSWD